MTSNKAAFSRNICKLPSKLKSVKKYIFTILALTIFARLSAQDIIIFRTGEEKETIVKKVGISTVEYLRYDNPKGAIYEVLKVDVFMIKYENGVKDIFEVSKIESLKESKLNQGVFIDTRDSITYKYVKIGNQIWMGENLRFKSGKSPCLQNSNKDCEECGKYYRFDDALLACPEGWHLPTDNEWMDLEVEAGMNEAEALKLGWRGTPLGQAPALLRKGQIGFELRLCGFLVQTNFSRKNPKYSISYMNEQAFYWTSSEDNYYRSSAIIRHFKGRASIERVNLSKKSQFPIRCVKDSDE